MLVFLTFVPGYLFYLINSILKIETFWHDVNKEIKTHYVGKEGIKIHILQK